MRVADLISILQQLDPAASVVMHEPREHDFFSITELTQEYLKPCQICYPHFDRAPKIAEPDTPAHKRLAALFIGTWLPT